MIAGKSHKEVIISDVTLRDGNHAVGHQIHPESIRAYARWAEDAGAEWVEVGHGNGLGASSFHIGKSGYPDEIMLMNAREVLTRALLSVHVMPGIARIDRDINKAIDIGVDIFRVASHCTEANTTLKQIHHVRNSGRHAVGVLMMSHMASPNEFLYQAKLMKSAGAEAIILMDSAGALNPDDISERFKILSAELDLPTGIHAHNNLGYATSNTIHAVKCGAKIIDACIGGFGAGAGNAQIELLIPLLFDLGFTKVAGDEYFAVAEKAMSTFAFSPKITSLTIATGRAGIFSGFLKPIQRAALDYGVSPFKIIEELGRRKVVAGQEDIVIEVAKYISTIK